MELLKEAELWVAVGLVLFFVMLVALKVPGAAAKALVTSGVWCAGAASGSAASGA